MSDSGGVFVARQPIVDTRQAVVAYELLFRASRDAVRAEIEDPSRASGRVIVDTFSTFGARAVLGPHLGFLNITREMLLSDLLEAVPREQVVLEILEDIPGDRAVLGRCRELRRRGYRLALDDYVGEKEREVFFDLVDFVKVETRGLDEKALKRIVRRLKRRGVKLLAEKVETEEEFAAYRDLGFQYFQGYYFAHPTTLETSRTDPGRAAIMRILAKLARDAEIEELEEAFKQHPDLSVNLLRIVNSAALALPHKIGSVAQAVTYLGRRHLRRWLTLLLYVGGDTAGFHSPLIQTAALRGRILELLLRSKGDRPAEDPRRQEPGGIEERAFLTGMLSLCEALMRRPVSEVVAELNVEDDIAEALLERRGVLGELLALVERLEAEDFDGVAARLEKLDLPADRLREVEVEAWQWVSGLSEEPDRD